MKKLLTIFGAFGLVATSGGFASSVVSCDDDKFAKVETYMNYYNEFKDKSAEEVQAEYDRLNKASSDLGGSESVLVTLTEEEQNALGEIVTKFEDALAKAEKTPDAYFKIYAEYGPQLNKYFGEELTDLNLKIMIIESIQKGTFK